MAPTTMMRGAGQDAYCPDSENGVRFIFRPFTCSSPTRRPCASNRPPPAPDRFFWMRSTNSQHTRQQRVYGSKKLQTQVEALTNRAATVRSRGRPRPKYSARK